MTGCHCSSLKAKEGNTITTSHENHRHPCSLRSRSSGSMELDFGRYPNPRQPGTCSQPTLAGSCPREQPTMAPRGPQGSVNGAITPKQSPEWEAAAARNAAAPIVKREAEAEPWYGWRGFSGAPIAGGALVIGQNSVTPD